MGAIAVIGAQWGDEAKGKIVHHLCRRARMCVRFNGGANAGHTVEDARGTARLHLVPCGALHPGCQGVIGHGVIVDPWVLADELEEILAQGRPHPELLLSERAHLVLPHHRLQEEREGTAERIGTTRRGVGPCYADRAARRGLRITDLADERRVREHLRAARVAGDGFDPEQVVEDLLRFREQFAARIGDARAAIAGALERGEEVVFEGAQGTLLDLDFGTYPYATSSTTTVHGIGWGTGISTARVERVLGVTKAYTTRVGEGPFPTEERGEVGERLRTEGKEYGATTGRPRRCGWLDLVALRYAHAVNGFTDLALTKLDVLSGLREIRVAVDYRIGGQRVTGFPPRAEDLARAEPVYEVLRGWEEDIAGIRDYERLPSAARHFVRFVEAQVGVPVTFIGTGPGEEAIIVRGRQ